MPDNRPYNPALGVKPGSLDDLSVARRDPRLERRLSELFSRFLTEGGTKCGVSVTLGATTKAVTFSQTEKDANYGVQITPNWNTTVWPSLKTTTGFTANFGTVAPAAATFDYLIFRGGAD